MQKKSLDKKSMAIVILSITALILMAANSITVRNAQAYSIKDRDYQLVTTRNTDGGDSLFVSDNRTGQVAVFNWDPSSKTIKLKDRKSLADMFVPR